MKYRFLALILGAGFLAGCETTGSSSGGSSVLNDSIRSEPPGNYFIGRRMFKKDYKVWGWVREPGKPWKTARLVMMNEQRKLLPDREQSRLGADSNYEYKLSGYFSGEMVYEPASDGTYPEFVFLGAEVKSISPPNIYQQKRQNDPAVRILQAPL